MDYLELKVTLSPLEPWNDILVAQLAEVGFESFVHTETGVMAYGQISEVSMEKALEGSFLGEHPEGLTCQVEENIIEHQNWNAVWESDFEPVYVEDKLSILAPFHDASKAQGMVVLIQPQMSFGTGHHQTTWMMSKALFELPKMPATVLDMGTGTGVLAIVAEKLGAKEILAIDIEDWSVENTIENAQRNNCHSITGMCGDVDLIEGRTFDLILANINKNVLKSHMQSYAQALVENGVLLLSGFFDSDVDELVAHANKYALKKDSLYLKDNWACIKLIKTM